MCPYPNPTPAITFGPLTIPSCHAALQLPQLPSAATLHAPLIVKSLPRGHVSGLLNASSHQCHGTAQARNLAHSTCCGPTTPLLHDNQLQVWPSHFPHLLPPSLLPSKDQQGKEGPCCHPITSQIHPLFSLFRPAITHFHHPITS